MGQECLLLILHGVSIGRASNQVRSSSTDSGVVGSFDDEDNSSISSSESVAYSFEGLGIMETPEENGRADIKVSPERGRESGREAKTASNGIGEPQKSN